MNRKELHGQIIDFRNLTQKQQKETLANYTSRLSKYNEIYTLTSEIEDAIKNDKDFYILVFLINDRPVAHIQFKYFKETKMIFVDYIYTLKNDASYTNTLYYALEERVAKIFDITTIVTEVSFSNKRRNRALEKLLALQDFKSLDFIYIQPPTETVIPSTGKLLMKVIKEEACSIRLIINDIYFKHYGYWYRKKSLYKYILKIIYQFQKYLINNKCKEHIC